jgi:integrase
MLAPPCSTPSPHPGVSARLEASIAVSNDGDFLFPSIRLNGTKPLSPDSLLKKSIRPALVRAGIEEKIIGWHNFRHTLGTLLRAIGTDIKVAQDLLRHANSRTTLDILHSRGLAAEARRQHEGR